MKLVTFYSNSCGGQHKNKIVLTFLSEITANHTSMEIIDHKFLESDHSYMECDIDHSIIEKAGKRENSTNHPPDDLFELVSKARIEQPFDIVQMKKTSFFNFEDIYTFTFVMLSKNQAKEKILFQEVKWLCYQKQL